MEKEKINWKKEIREIVVYIIIVIGLVFIVNRYIGQQVLVSGASMESTLKDKDHLILEKLSYRFGNPERFDIVVFQPYKEDKDLYYIKRVIGLPGETIQIIGETIYINGKELVENYGKESIVDPGIASEPITLGEEEYFVMGDNRNYSKDSRSSEVGVVSREAIMGRTFARIWPLSDIGILEHQ